MIFGLLDLDCDWVGDIDSTCWLFLGGAFMGLLEGIVLVRGDILTRLTDGGGDASKFLDGDKILVVAAVGVLCGVRGNVGNAERKCGGD